MRQRRVLLGLLINTPRGRALEEALPNAAHQASASWAAAMSRTVSRLTLPNTGPWAASTALGISHVGVVNNTNGAERRAMSGIASLHTASTGGGDAKDRTSGDSQLCCGDVANGVTSDAAQHWTVGGVHHTRGECATEHRLPSISDLGIVDNA